jgi:molybdenum-dependent DNA-binding transcriptional regulator ModE
VIGQLRREHTTVHGLARQLGTSWKTVWRAVEPELNRLTANEPRFEKSPRSVSMSTSGITQIPASAARRN